MSRMNQTVKRFASSGLSKGVLRLLLAMMALVPTLAFASGGENVVLNFTGNDRYFLYASLAFGALAIIVAISLSAYVMKQDPGNEKMRAVSSAIEEGANAYLSQQLRLMAVFVVILAIGLFFLYGNYGSKTAALMSLSFVLGVTASYLAGYLGMRMAVKGNTRTAHAALTSYKAALEIAFRSGAVAGMFTVGMGLIGATLIFLFAGQDAMKLLVGFGFGGSLAALFMRVGGGIFTKAADVGADLVGKVEAGIPEDDPRNPAVIADNVGDNVGDCAGMAADVFESYEVTLVAAIVLGAATASILDASTWMKLILFALMARGVGVVASIIGIYSMKGTDDLKSDPLKNIHKGFVTSALIAGVLTIGLAFWMMGGMGNEIKTSQFTASQTYLATQLRTIKKAQSRIVSERNHTAGNTNVQPDDITVADVKDSPEVLSLKIPEKEQEALISFALNRQEKQIKDGEKYSGYAAVDWSNPEALGPAEKYSVQEINDANGQPLPVNKQYMSVRDYYKDRKLNVYLLKVTQTKPAPPVEQGKPQQPPEVEVKDILFGPTDQATLDQQIKQAQAQKVQIETLKTYESKLYVNASGDLLIGIEGMPDNPQSLSSRPLSYYRREASEMVSKAAAVQNSGAKNFPRAEAVSFAFVEHKVVEWWRFVACIVFGLALAFLIEKLTDYYVSTDKRPVQEVGNVATAGPAPMIIQGFAYAMESSVFSVFAIVIALIAPLMIFPPAEFGGYILSFYGIALVGLGLLTTTGYILAMDTFGPISDNAQGVFEMSGAGHDNPEASRAVQRLDAAGNTTKALTKGFAIATAVVAAVALFHAYLDSGRLVEAGLRLELPEIFLGLMIGGAAPYLFAAFSMNAVGRAAFQLIGEVRRQFRSDAGIMAGTSKPDYGRCVAIVTAAAQKELLGPGILAIALPVMVGFGFAIGKPTVTIAGGEYNLVGAQALGGFLAGCIVSGQLMAVLLANSGGMWDNSKKLIEDGLHGGKGTDAHKAAVVCDTVGDPFKDTAGPALNPLIKVMNLFALLIVPYVIMPNSSTVQIAVTIGAILLLCIAFYLSKKESLSSKMDELQADPGSVQSQEHTP